jgi:hypothetical protein
MIWLKIQQVADLREEGDEPSDSLNCGEFLDFPGKY